MRDSGAQIESFTDHDGIENFVYLWHTQAPQPRGIIQIVHGFGEYAGRYLWAIERMLAAGFHVVADDHRGHGATGLVQYGGDYVRLGNPGPGGQREAARNVWHASSIARVEFRGLPTILYGHSWGSQIAQKLINRHGHDYAALMLTGTAYFMPGRFSPGDYNRNFANADTTGCGWLSRDPQVAIDFAADPLTVTSSLISTFGFTDSLYTFIRPTRFVPPKLPVLIAQGGDDPLGSPHSVARLARAYREVGLKDVSLRIYPQARHELLNETNKDDVVSDLLAWASLRMPG